MTTSTLTTIPLSQLIASPANVRRTGRNDPVVDLVASIAAHGLRQNLNVRPSEDGKRYEVVAGGRRLRALKQLAKAGRLAKDAPIACRILGEDDDASEISLVENALRTAMHPDDQCEAFRALSEEKGLPVEDIAARFGVTPAIVERRLRLARVAPRLRALYRKGDLSLEQMMAFALRDDHEAQERVWKELPHWGRQPRDIRAALTAEAVSASDRIALFVGLDAYALAGGAVLRDLFDEAHEGYLSDRTLLLALADAKLEALVETVRAEGWGWVTAEIEPDHSLRYRRLSPLPTDDEDSVTFAAEEMATAGVRIRIGHDGAARIERGLVEYRDEAPAKTPRVKEPGELSAPMVEELTAHRCAALRVALARDPVTALAVTVHALALPLLYDERGATCLDLRAASLDLSRHVASLDDCTAHAVLDAEHEAWMARLPAEASALLDWCLAASQETLLALLAFTASLTVDAVKLRQTSIGCPRLTHADALAYALDLDMTTSWKPSTERFYGKLPKATLIHIVTEAKAPMHVGIGTVKKDEAARYVAQAIATTDWLPVPLRRAA